MQGLSTGKYILTKSTKKNGLPIYRSMTIRNPIHSPKSLTGIFLSKSLFLQGPM